MARILCICLIDLTRNFTFGAYANINEFPAAGGIRTSPEVIAWANVASDHTEGRSGAAGTDTNKGPANAKSFGAIGAYEGHSVSVGRVVVDSTWHHWFDINIKGRAVTNLDSLPMNSSNPKTLGFYASPTGINHLSRIDNYYRNVAIWLCPKALQDCMFAKATWGIVIRYPLLERL